jgi:hypothetical protein
VTTNIDEMYQEELEGLDDSSTESWADYPLDTVFVRKDQRTVGEIVSRIKKGRYKLDPDFQRAYVWGINQQIRLIESSLMRIPLPVLYVAEDAEGRIIVVDGLQRLNTFLRYINDDFSLKNIGSDDPDDLIRDKKFSQLPIYLQERIEDTQLTLYILDSKAPERARLDIFERVNSGVPLTRQQMRNCLYSGPATKFLKEASESEKFLQVVKPATSMQKTMRDREIINRFCAFYINPIENYKGEMEDYLAEALLHINSMSQHDIDTIMINFIKSMSLNFKIFGKNSFRKSIVNTHYNQRTVLNVSLFDAVATCFALNWEKLEKVEPEILKNKMTYVLLYPPFDDSISLSTNNTQKIKYRHQLVNKIFNTGLNKSCLQNIIEYEMSFAGIPSDLGITEDLIDCINSIKNSDLSISQKFNFFNTRLRDIFSLYEINNIPSNIYDLVHTMFDSYQNLGDV